MKLKISQPVFISLVEALLLMPRVFHGSAKALTIDKNELNTISIRILNKLKTNKFGQNIISFI